MKTKLVCAAIASFVTIALYALEPPPVGSTAPDFSLTDVKGETFDLEGKAGRAYGAKNTPNMVVINPDGKIVYEGAIDSKATPNPADIPNSTNYVKVALDESLAGKPVTTSRTKPYGCAVEYK
jgi:hypothetical protein